MTNATRLHSWLDRSTRPTWLWERLALLALELPLYALAVVLAPTVAGWLAALVSLAGAVVAQAQRSVGARRTEDATRRGEGGHALTCERAAGRWATTAAILAGAAPVQGIALAAAGGALTRAALYAACVTGLRWAWGEGYKAWRSSRSSR